MRTALSLASLFLLTGTADARPPPSDPWSAVIALEASFAVLGPVGGMGGALEYSPTRNLALVIGGGKTLHGWRASAGARFHRPIRPRLSLGLEVWYGLGPSEEPLWPDPDRAIEEWAVSHQLRIGAGFEVRAYSGFRFRPFVGVAYYASESGSNCVRGSCSTGRDRRVFPYLGLALGYAIP